MARAESGMVAKRSRPALPRRRDQDPPSRACAPLYSQFALPIVQENFQWLQLETLRSQAGYAISAHTEETETSQPAAGS